MDSVIIFASHSLATLTSTRYTRKGWSRSDIKSITFQFIMVYVSFSCIDVLCLFWYVCIGCTASKCMFCYSIVQI